MTRKKPAIMTKDFRITVPPEVRNAQGWKPGQLFELVPRGSGVLLVPVEKGAVMGSQGSMRPAARNSISLMA